MAQTQKKQGDMGTGSVKKLLLQLMIPAVVAQIVNLLYNIVDRIYIGHIPGIGAAALTGVGLFTPILMLLNAFAMLIGAGGAPHLNQSVSLQLLQSGAQLLRCERTFCPALRQAGQAGAAQRRPVPFSPFQLLQQKNQVGDDLLPIFSCDALPQGTIRLD